VLWLGSAEHHCTIVAVAAVAAMMVLLVLRMTVVISPANVLMFVVSRALVVPCDVCDLPSRPYNFCLQLPLAEQSASTFSAPQVQGACCCGGGCTSRATLCCMSHPPNNLLLFTTSSSSQPLLICSRVTFPRLMLLQVGLTVKHRFIHLCHQHHHQLLHLRPLVSSTL
jgi:hypothetical protein